MTVNSETVKILLASDIAIRNMESLKIRGRDTTNRNAPTSTSITRGGDTLPTSSFLPDGLVMASATPVQQINLMATGRLYVAADDACNVPTANSPTLL